MRRCPATRCPNLIPTNARYCPTHTRQYDTRRGTSTQRGYGTQHQTLRAKWATRIAQHPIPCARCHTPITSQDTWDLDHDDTNRNQYLGPSHTHCNRSAAGKKSTQLR